MLTISAFPLKHFRFNYVSFFQRPQKLINGDYTTSAAQDRRMKFKNINQEYKYSLILHMLPI
jgi:hypothetical protein